MTTISATAVGIATVADDGTVLDTAYPRPRLDSTLPESAGLPTDASTRLDPEKAAELGGEDLAARIGPDPERRVEMVVVATSIPDLARAPADPHDAYLRLHLLSHRLVRPHQISVEGIFGVLNNVVWTSQGPCSPSDFESTRHRLEAAGRPVRVTSVDKFPRMTDYVVPTGVRIADADRVRLGAHLAEGTTVMHEGFVNFNAGTLGKSMVEGRISAGVVVGDGSDIGGGASIMGTLSGGGSAVISIGRRCLLGANAGLGISLGDDCIVEAGLYVTAGTVVSLPDGSTVKARELSGASGLLFRRNSVSGRVEALSTSGEWTGLNVDLHDN